MPYLHINITSELKIGQTVDATIEALASGSICSRFSFGKQVRVTLIDENWVRIEPDAKPPVEIPAPETASSSEGYVCRMLVATSQNGRVTSLCVEQPAGLKFQLPANWQDETSAKFGTLGIVGNPFPKPKR